MFNFSEVLIISRAQYSQHFSGILDAKLLKFIRQYYTIKNYIIKWVLVLVAELKKTRAKNSTLFF